MTSLHESLSFRDEAANNLSTIGTVLQSARDAHASALDQLDAARRIHQELAGLHGLSVREMAREAVGKAEIRANVAREFLSKMLKKYEDAERLLEDAECDLQEAQLLADAGCDEGLFCCESCRFEHLNGSTRQYAADCPTGGYDPAARVRNGAKTDEDILCQSWTPDRSWYFDSISQETRDKVPAHLKP